jgi:hypothetical protein
MTGVFWTVVGVAVFTAAWAKNKRDLTKWRLGKIAEKADQQHRWEMEGDPRGTYGEYPPEEV